MNTANQKTTKQQDGRGKLLIIVALSLGVFLFVTRQGNSGAENSTADDIVRPSVRPKAVGADVENIAKLPLERFKREREQVKKTHVFIAKSWYVPPPPPPPLPAPPPSVPPLPFTFMGKMQETGGKQTIYLAGNNQVYLVSGGEIIDNNYRVDGIENGKLALTYLPLQVKQYIIMGDTP